jgi:exosortase
MVSLISRRGSLYCSGAVLACVFVGVYFGFLKALASVWIRVPEFSYGAVVPVIVGYLLWRRRDQIIAQEESGCLASLGLVFFGCCLQVVASLSGTLLFSGVAFATTLAGMVGFVLGRKRLRIVVAPIALLILMVPLPSYAVDELTWRLQVAASTISSAMLELFGLPVYHDGNLLRLSNYVLEVKEACSGSRSIFALVALALVLGFNAERKWWVRLSLGLAAPFLAVAANVLRIVGTGLIAHEWGGLAANDSLHTAWGILTFVAAVMGLLAFHRILRWAQHTYA